MNTYKTIDKTSEGLYKEKGSKFISYAVPVSNIEEIKKYLQEYKKKYFDARHICFAYMLGENRDVFRVSDDGEPSGCAGRPIIGQINSYELTNILVVVVRYFGGILLGTGGLVVAYKEATIDAIQNANIITLNVTNKYKIDFDYLQMNDVMRLIKELNIQICQQYFDNSCVIEAVTTKENEDYFCTKLSNFGCKISKI